MAENTTNLRTLSKGKLKIISLYTEGSSQLKANAKNITNYIRAEKATTLLKTSREVISDSLVIVMVLKWPLFPNLSRLKLKTRKTN